MSAMPVVWCTNPNSSEKPTAFALQGIQLQGNISDQHVLAVQELIAAASEGRLILPSDGTVVLLDCGVGVGSVVVGNPGSQKDTLIGSSSSVLCDKLDNKTSNKLVIHHKAEVHTIREESDSEGIVKENLNDVSITKSSKIIKNKGRNENCDIGDQIERDTNQLYEFLCCAKCMSEGVSRCFTNGRKRSVNEKLIAKYLDKTRRHSTSSSSVVARDEQSMLMKARGIRKNSFKYMRGGTPSSATVLVNGRQSPQRKSSLPVDVSKTNDNSKTSQTLISIDESTNPEQQQETTTTCRKTSLDSICTVSSLDSGFIEMQNKLSSTTLANEGENHNSNNKNIEIIISEPMSAESEVNATEIVAIDQENNNKEVLGCNENNSKLIICSNSSSSTQQSRNRRKSYEEFKSMFRQNNERPLLVDTCSGATRTTSVPNKLEIVSEVSAIQGTVSTTTTTTDKQQPPTISRRKSYEEFKALVKICDNDLHSATIVPNNNTQSDYKSVANSVYNNNTTVYDLNLSSSDDTTPENTFHNGMKRKNSKRHSLSKKDRLINIFLNNKITSETTPKNNCDTIYDIIQKRPQKTENNGKNQNKDRLDKYRSKNFKIYDKFISYGTIYDIIQKKAEMYDTDFKQFEKYMTYGTIYEILRHKSDAEFPRRRVFSEKIYRQLRNNLLLDNIGHRYSTIHESMPGQRISNALTNKDSGDTESTTSEVWNNTNTLSTIYDILQTTKNRNLTNDSDCEKTNKNRFMVNKVSEDDLNDKTYVEVKTENPPSKSKSPVKDHSQKKQTRLRRFSNILSYKREKSPTNTNTTNHHHKKSTVSAPDPEEFKKKSSVNEIKEVEMLSVKNTNQLQNIPTLNLPESSVNQKTDELYSRINKLNLNGSSMKNHKSSANKSMNDKENRIYKSSSSNDISSHFQSGRDDVLLSSKFKINGSNQELKVPTRSDRKISANAKIISDKSKLCEQFVNDRRIYSSTNEKTRRLSEFTRGEFLNEKA